MNKLFVAMKKKPGSLFMLLAIAVALTAATAASAIAAESRPTSAGITACTVAADSKSSIGSIAVNPGRPAAGDSVKWDGSVDVSWYNPTDTVFYIDTPAKLAGLAAIVNGTYNTGATVIGNQDYIVLKVGLSKGKTELDATLDTWIYGADDFTSKTVCLTNDLDMGGVYDSATQTWNGPNYMPVGGQYCMTNHDAMTLLSSSWNGTFDGQGHTVKNINCDRYSHVDGLKEPYKLSQSIGLIGRMGVHDEDPLEWYTTPSVKNVAVTGCIYGRRSIGGIVGKSGRSNGSLIENCINYASVSNTDSKGVGGIAGAGWNKLTIRNCANFGNIYTSYSNAGGIAGSCEAKVYNCYNVGYVGAGAANQAQSLGTNNGGAVWTNCYWLDGSSASNEAVWGDTTGSSITKMETEASMKTPQFLTQLNAGGRDWVIDPSLHDGLPIPRLFAGPDTATVTSVVFTSAPAKLSYIAGQTFEADGLLLTANYSDGTSEPVPDYTISNTEALETGDTSLTISGTYKGVYYEKTYAINVIANALDSIEVTTLPASRLYALGESFDTTGMVVRAIYTNGAAAAVTNYTINPAGALTADVTEIVVSYSEGDITKTASVPITVLNSAAPQTINDIYQLGSANDLLWFANRVNSGLDPDIKAALTRSIDLSTVTWMPIGRNSTKAYTGSFDGGGYTVNAGTIGETTSGYNYYGLFGYAGLGACIANLAVEGTVNGYQHVGGILGYGQGVTITDCINKANVTGNLNAGGIAGNLSPDSTLKNCVNSGVITAGGNVAGGIIGCLSSGTGNTVSVQNCTNSGSVQAKSSAGGIIGEAKTASLTVTGCVNNGEIMSTDVGAGGIAAVVSTPATLTDCLNSAPVTAQRSVGGIVGYMSSAGSIARCANSGALETTSASTTTSYYAGGIAGGLTGAVTVDQCCNTGEIESGLSSVGGIVGYVINKNAGITNSYNLGDITYSGSSANANIGGIAGYSNNAAAAVQNCYNAGKVTADNTSSSYISGVIGYVASIDNISNNYYLNTTAARGIGNATDNSAGKTSEELKALAPTLGESFKESNAYPILVWQTPESYTVTVDSSISGGTVTVSPESGEAGDAITVTVTPAEGKRLVAGSLKYTADGQTYTSITAIEGVYSFVLPAANVTVTAQFVEKDGEVVTPAAEAVDGIAAVKLTEAEINGAIETVKKDGGDITIAPQITGEADKVSVELPKASLSSLATDTEADLRVETPVGRVTIPNETIASIVSQATGDSITVILESVDKEKTLNEAQKKAVGDKPVYDITIISGEKQISSFNGGKITISLPYPLKEGETADDVKVWYLNDKGDLVEITCSYDAKSGLATFTTDHLSCYTVGVEKTESGQVNRIAGCNRYDTSAKTALQAYPDGAKTVIIARGDDQGNFADALAASYLAGVEKAPILLTSPGSLPQEIEEAVKQLKAKKAYVLGGELAVSQDVVSKLKSLGLQVERIQGNNRYATAAAIAAKGGPAETAIVVSGFAPADSLAAGPLAFGEKYPILLVDKNSVPAETEKAIADLGINNIIVIGGENAVSKGVYDELKAKERYSGQSRIETSLAVAKKYFAATKDFSIVGYLKLADAVGAAVSGNPIIYVKNDISDVEDYLKGATAPATSFTIFGGTLAVDDMVENELKELLQ